jgi:hypothetical protein
MLELDLVVVEEPQEEAMGGCREPIVDTSNAT